MLCSSIHQRVSGSPCTQPSSSHSAAFHQDLELGPFRNSSFSEAFALLNWIGGTVLPPPCFMLLFCCFCAPNISCRIVAKRSYEGKNRKHCREWPIFGIAVGHLAVSLISFFFFFWPFCLFWKVVLFLVALHFLRFGNYFAQLSWSILFSTMRSHIRFKSSLRTTASVVRWNQNDVRKMLQKSCRTSIWGWSELTENNAY